MLSIIFITGERHTVKQEFSEKEIFQRKGVDWQQLISEKSAEMFPQAYVRDLVLLFLNTGILTVKTDAQTGWESR